jgi:hypothetical protein
MKKLACALGALLAGCGGGGRLVCGAGFAQPGEVFYGAGDAIDRQPSEAPIPCTAQDAGGGATRYVCGRQATGAERFAVSFNVVLARALPTEGTATIEEPAVYGEGAAVVCSTAAGCGAPVMLNADDMVGSNLRLTVSHAAGARSVRLSGAICGRTPSGDQNVSFGDIPLALP